MPVDPASKTTAYVLVMLEASDAINDRASEDDVALFMARKKSVLRVRGPLGSMPRRESACWTLEADPPMTISSRAHAANVEAVVFMSGWRRVSDKEN